MGKDERIRLDAVEVIKEYSDMVFRLAFARTGNQSDAQDIMQEVFLKYIQDDTMFEDKEHLKAWLIRVTINAAKNLMTSAWQRRTAQLEEADAVVVEIKEKSSVYYAMLELPEKYRDILHLFYYEDYSIEEISQILEMNESTVKSRLRRGRQKLKEILGGDEDEF